jgi:CheY-like chemotaxis protein
MAHGSICRILIVESYGSNSKSLAGHLTGLDLPVETTQATDAASALKHLEANTIDLVIIDACLRGKMDGYDLCRRLRTTEARKSLPIILLLAGYLSLERDKGINAGADLLLNRPVVKGELVRMIEVLMGWRFPRSDRTNNPPQPERPPLQLVHDAG